MNNDENAASLLQGYFWSIVFMMSMPFTVLSCVAIYFYLQVRKHRQATQSEPQRQPVLPTELPPGVLLAKSAQ